MELSAESVLALAPDVASAKAANGLLKPGGWPTLANAAAVWGECQGSGSKPYQTQVDLSGPTFKCSCPSRKFPCKHGLVLLLLKAKDPSLFKADTPPAWVTEWRHAPSGLRKKTTSSAKKPRAAARPVGRAQEHAAALEAHRRRCGRAAAVAARPDGARVGQPRAGQPRGLAKHGGAHGRCQSARSGPAPEQRRRRPDARRQLAPKTPCASSACCNWSAKPSPGATP